MTHTHRPTRLRIRPIYALGVLAVTAAVLAMLHSRPPAPPWIGPLRALPEVAAVEYTGPADAGLVVVHLLDHHYCPPELCAAAGLDFERHLALVEQVQAEQLSVARFLVGQFGLTGVYQEGLTDASVPDWELRLGLLRELDELERAGGLDDEARQRRRLLLLEVGVAGRLQLDGAVREVWPLDDDAALHAAKPVAGGQVVIDAERMRARERAMIGNLPEAGVALVVLGAAHDLRGVLPQGAGYARVQVKGFPE
jgi:hypothetical protein